MNLSDLPNDLIQRLNILGLEPLKTFRFAVQIDGDPEGKAFVAGFSEVSGIDKEVEVRKIREGGNPGIYTFPRNTKAGQLVLTRPMLFSRSLFNWFGEVQNWTKGKPDYRRSVSVFLLDEVSSAGRTQLATPILYEAWRWDFFGAYPTAWSGPKLDSMRSETAREIITLQHTGISEGLGVLSGDAGEILSVFQR